MNVVRILESSCLYATYVCFVPGAVASYKKLPEEDTF